MATQMTRGKVPDFLCIGKGITSGALPMSMVLTNKKIYDIFLKSNNQMSGIKSYNLVVNLLIQDYQSKINSSVDDSS